MNHKIYTNLYSPIQWCLCVFFWRMTLPNVYLLIFISHIISFQAHLPVVTTYLNSSPCFFPTHRTPQKTLHHATLRQQQQQQQPVLVIYLLQQLRAWSKKERAIWNLTSCKRADLGHKFLGGKSGGKKQIHDFVKDATKPMWHSNTIVNSYTSWLIGNLTHGMQWPTT